ncbi:MAG: DNA polymerase III subunit delta, partial [Methylocella sp.]
MVAVKSHEAERFLARPPLHIYLYLVFGTDAGLVAERARTIVARAVDDLKDPFQFVRIGGDELANDPARLADEANTIPMFGSRRAILIEAQGKTFVAAFEPFLGAPPRDCTIVIEAGALKKDAPLRTLCERAKNAAAIQCYPDSEMDIAQLIDAEVSAAGLSIAPDAKAFLVSQLGQDRLSTRSELEKLV